MLFQKFQMPNFNGFTTGQLDAICIFRYLMEHQTEVEFDRVFPPDWDICTEIVNVAKVLHYYVLPAYDGDIKTEAAQLKLENALAGLHKVLADLEAQGFTDGEIEIPLLVCDIILAYNFDEIQAEFSPYSGWVFHELIDALSKIASYS